MGLTDITFTIRDGALGQGEPGSSPIPLLIGVASSGEINVIESYVSQDDFRDDYGTGPLVDMGCYALSIPGNLGIRVLKVNSWQAGAVTKTAAGVTTGTMTAASSLPLDDYKVKSEITTGGLLGIAVMKYSLDNGITYTAGVSIPASGTVEIAGTGLVLQFSNGVGSDGFTLGDIFAFNVVTDAEVSRVTRTPYSDTETTIGTMNTTGSAPLDSYNATIIMTQGGILGEAAFKYSLDGVRYSGEIAVPGDGVYAVAGTGMILTFDPGVDNSGFTAGDKFTFTTTAPGYSLDALEAALQAWIDSTTEVDFLHILGNSGSAPSAMMASLTTYLDTAEAAHKFVDVVLETRDQASSEATVKAYQKALKTEWVGVVDYDRRFTVVPGYCDLYLPASKMTTRRPNAWVVSGRMSSRPFSEDPGRYDVGPLVGVKAIYMDARVDKTLNDSGFTLLTTYDLESNFYCQGGQQFVEITSDYRYTKEIMVMNKTCSAAYKQAKKLINTNVLVDRKTGKISEISARSIDNSMTKAVEKKLFPPAGDQHASAVSVKLDRTTNFLSTPKGTLKIRLIPLATIRELAIDIGFENPFLS